MASWWGLTGGSSLEGIWRSLEEIMAGESSTWCQEQMRNHVNHTLRSYSFFCAIVPLVYVGRETVTRLFLFFGGRQTMTATYFSMRM